MKKSNKALLFSALVFPGAGHFFLKRYARGLVIFIPSMIALVYFCNDAMQKASSITDKILSGEIAPDAQTITNLVSNSPSSSNPLLLNAATLVMVACWIFGIVDSYRIGRQIDYASSVESKR